MQETQETWVWSLDQEDPLEEKMVTLSSVRHNCTLTQAQFYCSTGRVWGSHSFTSWPAFAVVFFIRDVLMVMKQYLTWLWLGLMLLSIFPCADWMDGRAHIGWKKTHPADWRRTAETRDDFHNCLTITAFTCAWKKNYDICFQVRLVLSLQGHNIFVGLCKYSVM